MMHLSKLKYLFQHKTIALIGNAESLDTKKYGKIIESHDLVCRINRGPIKTPSKSHGNRTDILFYGDPGQIVQDVVAKLNPQTPCIIPSQKFADREHPLKNVLILNQESSNFIKESCGYFGITKWPSNGLAAFFIITKCNPKLLSLFGFDWKKSPTFYRHDIRGDDRHDYYLEENFIKDMVKNSEININIY